MTGIEQIRREVALMREHVDPHPDNLALCVAHELGMVEVDWSCPVDRAVMALIEEVAAA